ncbi:5063_t:CDS:10 [Diversispora eburnea]|uniref:1-(5-phosphoribosyl)-5-[(5-phosphoribosylamino)methylideneamino] imidazole-4-carboxamide isomerase n=1 Tax=Diversispora eburnea TaxID=1213867 RepID=A0A9N9AAH8_9GLOM|nr:5063_t:CDS:10 [Diversispora eburnea]
MPRTKFRPCIDLHDGQVKQIVGGSLNDINPDGLKTNFVSKEKPSYYAKLYKENYLTGAHVIKLGIGNDEAAKETLKTWPGGLQVGGGITLENAEEWIKAGAKFSLSRLQELCKKLGKERIVIDVRQENKWIVAMNKWQTMTDMEVNKRTLDLLANYCSEFLIHAADVEGLCQGIDTELVECLGKWTSIPTTYAGGAKSIADLDLVNKLSNGKIDLTFGSALDIFGGTKVKFEDCVKWNNNNLNISHD